MIRHLDNNNKASRQPTLDLKKKIVRQPKLD